MSILAAVKEVLEIEAQGILNLIPKLGKEFEEAVNLIYGSQGRVIITGIGKSGIVARKIVATLNSTGTPSLFLHPVEAMHGDLGMVTPKDIVLALSNSGETGELTLILPSIRRIGAKFIAFTGNPESTLAKQSDIAIDVGVEKEACPWGMVPTASTTAALAAGDALAVALIKRRQFNHQDFRRFHPGGTLGERLTVRVAEVMLTGDRIPLVSPDQPLEEAIREMDRKDLGATLVVEGEEQHPAGDPDRRGPAASDPASGSAGGNPDRPGHDLEPQDRFPGSPGLRGPGTHGSLSHHGAAHRGPSAAGAGDPAPA